MNKKIIVSCCTDCKFRSNFMGGICDHPSFGTNPRVVTGFLYKSPPDWCPLPPDIEDDTLLDNSY